MNSPSSPRRLLPVVAVVAIAAVVAFAVVRSRSSSTLSGIVTTDTVLVSPEIQGRLERLLVTEGDEVQQGQLLAEIRADEWQADLSYFESTERQAESMVTQASADLDRQQALTRSEIRQAEAALAAANAQVAAAQAEMERVQIAYDRADALRNSGASSAEAFDEARINRTGSQARLEALRQQAEAATAALDAARAGESQVAARRASLDASKDVLAAAKAQREKAATRLAYSEVKAPIAGFVNMRAARQGEIVGPGKPILSLVNPNDYWVRIDVEESLVDRLKRGDRLTVRLPSGAEREGEVYYVAVDADYATQRDVNRSKRDIRTFEVRLRVDNSDRSLALGMTAYVDLPSR